MVQQGEISLEMLITTHFPGENMIYKCHSILKQAGKCIEYDLRPDESVVKTTLELI